MHQSVVAYAKRTPIGRLNGALASVPSPELAGAVVKDALATTGIAAESVDEMILGCVLPAGVGQAPARQAGFAGGLPKSVCATTINRVCGSGLKAIMLADQAVRLGDSRIVFAGGAESMTRAPHLLPGSRGGFKFGPVEMQDHMQYDGLWDPYAQKAMGNFGDLCAKEHHFTREEQDAFAVQSYERARAASESGHFASEIVPIEIATRKGVTVVDRDEEPFAADLSRMGSLGPAFEADGTVTAANASTLNDGAAITVVMSEEAAREQGVQPIAGIVAQASFAQDPAWFTTAPIECIRRVLKRAELTTADIDLFEINEAFAVVALAAIRELGLDPARVNPYGGAVALGHPIGASGARLMATLLNGLRASGGRYGLATLCIGGGEASAVIVELI
ncbi:MAG: thiolase family protein [Dehalococcoidia bacterium]|nr:thiolase family protein [Dehalococcoidia bacterium]